MKIETILSAMVIADRRRMISPHKYYPCSERQYHAFRDRILRMDKEKDEEIKDTEYTINLALDVIVKKDEEIRWLNQRVHELKGEIECIRIKQ